MAKDLKKKINKLNKKVEKLLSEHKLQSELKDQGIYDKIIGYLGRFESEHHLFEALDDALDKQAKSLVIAPLDEVVEKPQKTVVKPTSPKKLVKPTPVSQDKKTSVANTTQVKKVGTSKPVAKTVTPKK